MTVVDDILNKTIDLNSLLRFQLNRIGETLGVPILPSYSNEKARSKILAEVYTYIHPHEVYNLPIPHNARLATLLTYYSELLGDSSTDPGRVDFTARVMGGELEPLEELTDAQLTAILEYLDSMLPPISLPTLIRTRIATLESIENTDNFDVSDVELGL